MNKNYKDWEDAINSGIFNFPTPPFYVTTLTGEKLKVGFYDAVSCRLFGYVDGIYFVASLEHTDVNSIEPIIVQ
jgi:hypothetical protein